MVCFVFPPGIPFCTSFEKHGAQQSFPQELDSARLSLEMRSKGDHHRWPVCHHGPGRQSLDNVSLPRRLIPSILVFLIALLDKYSAHPFQEADFRQAKQAGTAEVQYTAKTQDICIHYCLAIAKLTFQIRSFTGVCATLFS